MIIVVGGSRKVQKEEPNGSPLDMSLKESCFSFQTAMADRAPGRPSPQPGGLGLHPAYSGEVRAGSQFGEIKEIFHEVMEIGMLEEFRWNIH